MALLVVSRASTEPRIGRSIPPLGEDIAFRFERLRCTLNRRRVAGVIGEGEIQLAWNAMQVGGQAGRSGLSVTGLPPVPGNGDFAPPRPSPSSRASRLAYA